MKNQSQISKVLLTAVAFLFTGYGLMAQVHVATDGDVGVGATNPAGKLHVHMSTTSASYSAYILNSITGSSNKNGLYNYVTNAGTGTRYGMRNYTYSPATGSNSSFGLYNRSISGKGSTYGDYTYTTQATGATGVMRGIYNYVNTPTSGNAIGIYNYNVTPAGATGIRYGVYTNTANSGSGTTYGLYSRITGNGYAGYFNGNVHVIGTITQTSDARKKENVKPILNALSVISQLEPKSYTFKAEKNMNLPEGEQFGFMAQELEVALPGLVKTVAQPVMQEADGLVNEDPDAVANGEVPQMPAEPEMTTEEFKSINYVALIPVLVQAVKEQQTQIEAQQQEIAALRKLLEEK